MAWHQSPDTLVGHLRQLRVSGDIVGVVLLLVELALVELVQVEHMLEELMLLEQALLQHQLIDLEMLMMRRLLAAKKRIYLLEQHPDLLT